MGATALDRVGTHHGAMSATSVSGVVGSAFHFNLLTSIDVPYATALVPSAGFTLELWLRRDGPQSTYARIAGMQVDGVANSTWVFGISAAQGVYFGLFKGGQQAYIDGAQPIPDQTWTHVAATWDGVVLRAYLNGAIQPDVAAITGPLTDPGLPLRIGRGTSASGFAFSGDLDELTLFNRALTQQEISAIVTAGPLGKCK